jgi:hypothetical protein
LIFLIFANSDRAKDSPGRARVLWPRWTPSGHSDQIGSSFFFF